MVIFNMNLFKKQKNIINQILSILDKNVVTYLIKSGQLYIPGSDCDDQLKKKIRALVEKENACVYFVLETTSDKKGKVGCATNGKKRVHLGYDKTDNIIYIFNYDYADDDIINHILPEARQMIQNLEGVSLSDKEFQELTLEEALKLSREGLCIFPRLVLHSLVNGSNDDKFIGGAAEIAGFRRRADLQDAESGIQTNFSTRPSVGLHEASRENEHLHSNLMGGWVMPSHEEAASHADQLWHALNAVEPHLMEYNSILQNILATLGWPRAGVNDNLDACKVHILKLILGDNSKECYKNAIEKPPSETSSDLFKSSLYTLPQIKNGYPRIEDTVTGLEDDGGIHILDTNDLVMLATQKKNMVDWLQGRDWEVVYSCFDVVTMTYKGERQNEPDKPRVIFVCRPWCWMLYSGPGKYRMSEYNSQAKRAKSAHLMQAIISRLRQGSSYDESDKIEPRSSFFGNFLTAFAMRLFLLYNFHMFPMHATLFAKNLLDERNLFEKIYHALAASERGVNLRQQRGSVTGTRDYQQREHMQNTLTLDHMELSDRIDKVVSMICEKKHPSAFELRKVMFGRLVRDYLEEGDNTLAEKIKQQLAQKKDQQESTMDQNQNVEIEERKRKLQAKQKCAAESSSSSSSDSN